MTKNKTFFCEFYLIFYYFFFFFFFFFFLGEFFVYTDLIKNTIDTKNKRGSVMPF